MNAPSPTDDASSRPNNSLPEIPVIDATGAEPHQPVLTAEKDRLEMLVAAAQSHYGKPFIRLADRLSRGWLHRNSTPYLADISSIAAQLPAPGGWFLNASFEWGCTCGIAPDATGKHLKLMRVLDWPLDGLGKGLVVTRQSGPAGEFFNITWPGFAGVVTGCAPGRFAIAINQAPLKPSGLGCWGDWAMTRPAIWRSTAMPPMHLLRRVFEQCVTYEEAQDTIKRSPLAVSAIFSIIGTGPAEGCVIERTATEARIHEAPVAVANHWINPAIPGRTRGTRSHDRHSQMTNLIKNPVPNTLEWLSEPVLNHTTRLASVMDPVEGTLLVRGYETNGPATRPLELAA